MKNAELAKQIPGIPAPKNISKAPIQLCLFDLDDTLLYTDDLECFRGPQNCGQPGRRRVAELKLAYRQRSDRYYYDETILTALREQYPAMKWGVFTRAPEYYAKILLELAYPSLSWNCLIARETVASTKPDGAGIAHAMRLCRISDSSEIVLVGDGKMDILAAYSGGCRVVLTTQSWPERRFREHYHALEKIPDAIISTPEQLTDYLANPEALLPELEFQLSSCDKRIGTHLRVDLVNHFYPYEERRSGRGIFTMGRFLANYQELDKRREWHALTQQIHQHKDAQQFPEAWIEAIRNVLWSLAEHNDFTEFAVTVIPHKPGRVARLEALLSQVEISCHERPIHQKRFCFIPDLFIFNDEAISSHKNHLSKSERFENVRRSLSLSNKHGIDGRCVLVMDDVVTTGATLLHAADCLENTNVLDVALLALAKNVSWW